MSSEINIDLPNQLRIAFDKAKEKLTPVSIKYNGNEHDVYKFSDKINLLGSGIKDIYVAEAQGSGQQFNIET